jgi:hypothetical protein
MRITTEHPTDRPNFYSIHIDQAIKVWFSYETPIAFQVFDGAGKQFIRENDWSNTTGKHLNYIDPDKSNRISGIEFEKRYNDLDFRDLFPQKA